MSLVEQALKRAKAAGRQAPLAGAGRPTSDDVMAPAAASAGQSPGAAATDSAAEITATHEKRPAILIDAESLRRVGYLPPPDQEREVAEQFRHIKRPLLARAFGRGATPVANGRVIMVSSALPGEGKTFCAINLARSLCLEADSSVLLIDADTARPQVSKTLGLLERPGLVEALQDEQLDIETLIEVTNVPKLSVLGAGHSSGTAAELLGSSRMVDLLRQLTSPRSPNRVVVLDSPPLLVTNEAKTLVDLAGQVVLVVRASSTPQSAVLDAISHLREDQVVGLILNESHTVAGVGYGYGYYDRMYKYGASEADDEGAK